MGTFGATGGAIGWGYGTELMDPRDYLQISKWMTVFQSCQLLRELDVLLYQHLALTIDGVDV